MSTQVCSLLVEKMNCASCVSKIENKLNSMEGVLHSSVNFASGHATVEIDPSKTNEKNLIHAISSLGYPAKTLEKSHHHEEISTKKQFQLLLWRTIGSIILSIPLVLHMFGVYIPGSVQWALATVVQFGGGWPFYVGTWRGLKSFSANMDTLVALGTTVAYLFSTWNVIMKQGHVLYFETSSVLISFILIGKVMEMRSKEKAKKGMKALLQLQPKLARVKKGKEFQEISVNEVAIDDIFLIRPGERIPVDGTVLKGSSQIDESMLTGESIPVEKQTGSHLFAGTVNGHGSLEAKATKVGSETTLAHIIHLVEEAQSSKAPIQRLADKVSGAFVPVVLLIALFTFLLWWLMEANLQEGIVNAIAVLIIACPCALGLATPIVIMVASIRGAQEGILIKDASAFEKARKIQNLIVDKTGTVTEGHLSVKKIALYGRFSEEKIHAIAKTLAEHSEHPASLALVKYFKEKEVSSLPLENFHSIPGRGIKADVEGKSYFLGSIAFMHEQEIALDEFQPAINKEKEMVVVIASEKKALGYFVLIDQIKKGSNQAVEDLHQMQIKVFLLTGDRRQVAEQVAQKLGMDGYEAEVLPEEKTHFVEKMKKMGKVTGMVGDGVNDAPALAAADVGFAVASGTDVAMETASIGIMRSQLSGVVDAIRLAKKTYNKMWQNLGFAFIYNILGIPLAAFGFLNPLIAGAAMALSSVSVVLNALLLQKK